MNKKHLFIYTPGVWLGQGKIRFSMSAEELNFYTRWTIEKKENNIISCLQEIEVEDVPDKMINKFTFSKFQKEKFSVSLTNDILGSVEGTGLIDDNVIAWEFRGQNLDFEGFEVFEKEGEDRYLTKAEFSSKDQMRTLIEGTIWHKPESDDKEESHQKSREGTAQ